MKTTKSFGVLKTHCQQMLDFGVLVTTAVPQLRYALSQLSLDPSYHIERNTVFTPSADPHSNEKRAIAGYEEVLGATMLFSIFSYFESYFFGVVEEVLEFHGGVEEIEERIQEQLVDSTHDPQVEAALESLRKPYAAKNDFRVRNKTSLAKQGKVVWPSQRLMLFGLQRLSSERRKWKAFQIPELAKSIFGVSLTAQEVQKFTKIREDRNGVAHRDALSYPVSDALKANEFIRATAKKIDAVIVKNFMLTEKYAH